MNFLTASILFLSVSINTAMFHNVSNVLQANWSIPTFVKTVSVYNVMPADFFLKLIATHKERQKAEEAKEKSEGVMAKLEHLKPEKDLVPKRSLSALLNGNAFPHFVSDSEEYAKGRSVFNIFPHRLRWKREKHVKEAAASDNKRPKTRNFLWQRASLMKAVLSHGNERANRLPRKKRSPGIKEKVQIWESSKQPQQITGDDSIDLVELADAREDLENIAEALTEPPGFVLEELKQISESGKAPALSVYEAKPRDRQKMWHEWGDWTPCSVSCGEGWMTRQRRCLFGHCEENEMEIMQEPCTMADCHTV